MREREIIVDNFAGGGGASEGIEDAIGRAVDVAINHDPDAIAMHKANHPNTKHYCEDVFSVDPREAAAGRPVALCWLSPDCKHFSKAKGGTPVSKKIRGLAWVAVRWAATVKPRVMILENVEEFKSWGPLIMTEEGPKPDPARKGHTFNSFIRALKRHGYHVEFKELRACDYGAPTTRKRLFMIARCDGQPIRWPEPTHGPRGSLEVESGILLPYRTAAECIDWDLPGTSIFGRKKPLSPNTMRRIARGLKKFVIDNPEPFIVPGSDSNNMAPSLIQMGYGDTEGKRVLDLSKPLGTITAGGNKFGLAAAWIKKDYNNSTGDDLNGPISTITSQSNHHSIVSAFISKTYGGQTRSVASGMNDPLHTVTMRNAHSLVEVEMEPKAKRNLEIQLFFEEYYDKPVFGDSESAFITKYYGRGEGQSANEPLHTVPTKDRFGLVRIKGEDYRITDITLRMLHPKELARGQGVRDSYIIDRDMNGKKISKAKQIARIGNMVVPNCSKVLVQANLPELCRDTSNPYREQIELLNEDFGWQA